MKRFNIIIEVKNVSNKKKTTITQVAKYAGVSIGTVSISEIE